MIAYRAFKQEGEEKMEDNRGFTIKDLLIRLILKSNKIIAAATPIMMLLFMFICPVFIDIQTFRPIQNFLPSFQYLTAVHNNMYIIGMLVYTLICSGVYFVLTKILRKS